MNTDLQLVVVSDFFGACTGEALMWAGGLGQGKPGEKTPACRIFAPRGVTFPCLLLDVLQCCLEHAGPLQILVQPGKGGLLALGSIGSSEDEGHLQVLLSFGARGPAGCAIPSVPWSQAFLWAPVEASGSEFDVSAFGE